MKVATAFSGIGAFEQALIRLNIPHEILFACDNGNRIIDIDYDKEFETVKKLKTPREKKEYVDSLLSLEAIIQTIYLKLLKSLRLTNRVYLFLMGSLMLHRKMN